MRRVFSFVFLTTLLISMPGLGAVIPLAPSRTSLELENAGTRGEVIHLSVAEISLDEVEINGENWALPQVEAAQNSMEKGLPSIPMLHSSYLLGQDNGISLELKSVTTRRIDLSAEGFAGVVPSKGHFGRNIDPSTVPWVFDAAVYEEGKSYPTADSQLSSPFIAGAIRAQDIEIPLMRWNSADNSLVVIEDARFEIHQLDAAPNPRIHAVAQGAPLSPAALHALNGTTRSGSSVGRLLILCYDDFLDEIQPLVDWEKLVGFPTVLTALTAVPHSGGSPTAAEIKNYIQGLYDAPEGLAWVILVGDSGQIPTLSGVNEGAPCDTCYVKLEGADNHPDAAISRISAQTGTDVTVQVNKFLNYERYPDTGSAAGWYTGAFGIAGDDTGGSPSYADYERMEMLRKDLVTLDQDPDEPHYNYADFDQLYHSPSRTDVKNSVETGRSLGLYIGHGGETSWVTSGFSVSDVNNLVNGDLLPVIWDVACVNGRFTRSGGDCFAESWLKRDGGGAVSFEGATTNEDWVPPCDAQRGVVDSIRLETAFMTGAQHLAGKEACFTINGDSNSSAGTQFAEQSTLFGSAVLWPRTAAPSLIDTPDDFAVSGNVASLTVKVGGSPLMLSGGAIVNFYVDNGGQPESVGAAFIDANGVAQATVSQDPTYCHIHGHNLVPASFELAATTDARISLDAASYSCSSTVAIRVADADPSKGKDAATVSVDVSTGSSSTSVILSETTAGSGFYTGNLVLGTDLAVSDGETLTASYLDSVNSEGSPVTREATATVDCAAPIISSVSASATEDSIVVSFQTSEPGTGLLRWGTSVPPTQEVSDSALSVDHSLSVDGLGSCQRIYYELESEDSVGNQGLDNNGGQYFTVDTAGWATVFSESFESDPGWSIENGNHSSDGWAFGVPTGSGQDSYGNPDPTSGHSGANVYGVNLGGDAPASLGENELTLTTPSIDLSNLGSAQLKFWRWLGVEGDTYDNARVRMSVDQGPWTIIWENTSTTIDDSSWSEQSINIDAAAGHADVRIQWSYGSTDSAWNYCGWNIDDVSIEGSVPCMPEGGIFFDDFEGGSCSSWSWDTGR